MIDTALKCKIAGFERSVPDRIALLESIVKGKIIIDLGFADHREVIDKKIKMNRWLHKRLKESALYCLGIDNNAAAVEYCMKLGVEDIICEDIGMSIPRIDGHHWDYIILGEIIEHQNNPSEFLSRLWRHNTIDKLIITTPNALRLENFWFALKHTECINSDHRFWFTPYTLSQAVKEAGMTINWIKFCQGSPIPFYKLHKRLLLMLFPALRDTIILETEF